MQLRTNRVLKNFVILLFSLESLAPSVFFVPTTFEDSSLPDGGKRFFTHTVQMSIYAEECDVEERDPCSQEIDLSANKIVLAFQNYQTVVLPILFTDASSNRVASSPPLFRLHCLYRI